MPDGVACLWIQLFQLLEERLCGGAISGLLVGTQLELFLVMLLLGILLDVSLLTQAQRTDNGQRHLLHPELGRHRRELPLEGEVHQGSMDDVILVMAKGYLGTTQLLSDIEELLAALPGTEETGGLLFALARRRTVGSGGAYVGSSRKAGGNDVERNTEAVAERLQVGGVCLVMNIVHADMQGLNGEVGDVDL